MYLFGLLFRVQDHGVMMCSGNLIFMRFCFILYLKEGELVLYSLCFKCFPARGHD